MSINYSFSKLFKKIIPSVFLLCFISSSSFGQGIKGVISDENGKPLPYASIYIKEKNSGTTANIKGYYEFRLETGEYDVSYQFMGYETQNKTLKIGKDIITLNIVMDPESFEIQAVTIVENAEDPAYTIMRKAISKAKFHLLQCDKYSAMVYTKGTGMVKKIPGLFRKTLEDDGVDTSRAFTSESVSEISFLRPNTFSQRVISIRASGKDDANANPNGYVNASFYQPEVVQAISPLSPSAFRYYKFEYLGSFQDRGYEINKIKVIPRSKGDNVYEGEIYIRENYFNIHSLKLKAKLPINTVTIEQIFAPVGENIWMPITQKYHFDVSFFGFEAQYDYYASVQNYQIVKNGELDAMVSLVDEKIEEAPDKLESIKDGETEKGLKEVFDQDKKVSNKQFFQLMEDYEEDEMKATENEDVLYDYSFKVDSSAKSRDSTYWANVRSVPLTQKEIDSYKIEDSVYVATADIRKNDSLRIENGDSLRFGDLFFGGYYKLWGDLRFNFPGFVPQLRYNTVEGLNLDFTGVFSKKGDTALGLTFEPYVRYGFASERFYTKGLAKFGFGKGMERHQFSIDGGRYISQFQPNSINPLVNSLYTLFLERNYMRLYEKEYIKVGWKKSIDFKYQIEVNAEWANRNQLENANTNFSIINWKDTEFTSNDAINFDAPIADFNDNKAFITEVKLKAQPWLKFRKFNGKIFPINGSSPVLQFSYKAGWEGILNSTSGFHRLEGSVNSSIKMGAKATFDYELEVGTTFGESNQHFIDYKHFEGQLTEFAPLSLTGNYRILDYYNYSTSNSYVSALTYIRFRKLLFTQITPLRLFGIKENFFVNYLKTDYSTNYTEIGYTLDNIFSLFRIELVQSFSDLEPTNFGVRIGVSAVFGQ